MVGVLTAFAVLHAGLGEESPFRGVEEQARVGGETYPPQSQHPPRSQCQPERSLLPYRRIPYRRIPCMSPHLHPPLNLRQSLCQNRRQTTPAVEASRAACCGRLRASVGTGR